MIIISIVLVAVLGIVMLGRGVAAKWAKAASSDASAQTSTIDASGVQKITTTMTTSRSYPAITVTAGVPVVWTFKADENVLNGCNNAIVIPEYNIQQKLTAGDTVIKFTPTKTGTQQYTCWMGMVSGRINVIEGNAGTAAAGSAPAESVPGESVPAASGILAGKGSCCVGG